MPSHIPASLKSYLAQFQEQPEIALEKLEKHVRKRGPDAVGHYLLSWLYHFRGDLEMAVRAAWRAKIYAPGSPAMEQLHYFMAHPKNFNAWKPSRQGIRRRVKKRGAGEGHPISDLDALIHKLSSVEPKRISIKHVKEDGPDLAEASSHVEDIVTETLAGIHEKQGNRAAAIETYRRLMNIHTHKKGYYKAQIDRLKKEE